MKAKRLGAVFLAAFFAYVPFAGAEVMTYEGTGEYVMSDFETPDIAKQRAKARAEQNCVEQAGVYVKSYTRTVNSIVTEDEVEAIANNIINVEEEKYNVTPLRDSGGSFRVVVTIRATVDSGKIDAWMARDYQKNIELIEQNRRLKEEKKRQDAEIADLRRKLVAVKGEQDKKRLESSVINSDIKFLSNQKVQESIRLITSGRFAEAVEVASEAIRLDRGNAGAYSSRGNAYWWQVKYEQAIMDYSKAIEISPNQAGLYYCRGVICFQNRMYKLAISDLNKAIEMKCKNDAYWVRSGAYYYLGRYQEAIRDVNKFIELNPKYANAYGWRALCYLKMGNKQLAKSDANRAIKLDPSLYGKFAWIGSI